MSGEVTLRSAGSPIDRVGTPEAARSTAGVAFNVKALMFSDLPSAAQRDAPAAGVLAECVVKLPGARRDRTGLHQTLLAFRAYPERIVYVEVERPLTRRDDGRLAPAGAWALANRTVFGGTRAVRTSGVVAPGVALSNLAEPGGATVTPRHHVTADEAFLPAAVRSGLAAAVPNPIHRLSRLLLMTRNGVDVQELTVLRVGGDRAAVVFATRADEARASWEIQQWVYELRKQSRGSVAQQLAA